MIKICVLFGQSILPDRNWDSYLIEVTVPVRNLFMCKESVYPNIAHSGNKGIKNERREGERKEGRET